MSNGVVPNNALKEKQIGCSMSKRDTCLFLVPLRYVCNIFIGKFETKNLLVRSKCSCDYDKVKVKVQQSRYSPGQAQTVPGG